MFICEAFEGAGLSTAVIGKSVSTADTGRYFLGIQGTGAFLRLNVSYNIDYTFTDGTNFVGSQIVEHNTANTLRVNGVQEGSTAITDAASYDNTRRFEIGRYQTTSDTAFVAHSGAFYGAVVVRSASVVSSTDIENTEAYLAAKSGVTL